MRAVVITEAGPPDVLRVEQRPSPEPKPGEILVRVSAAALNRADLLQRRGLYPAPGGVPEDIPGLEFSGIVLDRGTDSNEFEIGDRVMGLVPGGAYAEQVAVAAETVLPVPPQHSDAEAAAIPEAFLTAFDALIRQAELKKGETVLIHACASGVGTAAIQLAAGRGATVVGTSRSGEKLRKTAPLGLSHGIEIGSEQLAKSLLERLGTQGVDVILDLVGQANWPENLELLASRGRIIVVGLVSGGTIELDLRQLMQRRGTIIGTVLRGRSLEEKASLVSCFRREALPLFETGNLRPIVDTTFPLEEAVDAHRYMEANRNVGKIVLTVS